MQFINLRQGGKSVHEYSFELIKLSKYASCLVSNPRYQMSRLVIGVLKELQEEFQTTILNDNMNISLLMVYARRGE